MKFKPFPHPFLATLPAAAALLFAGPASAQKTSSDVAGARPAEETIQLSPFQVGSDRDIGYEANDVISAGLIQITQ